MNLIQLIRILARKWKLILFTGLSLAILVFFLTRNTKPIYVSETSIYTGIASGISIESIDGAKIDYNAVKNAFDNVLFTIESRETLEETGMRLLASHLVLEAPRDEVLSQDSWDWLKEKIPADVWELLKDSTEEATYQNILVSSQEFSRGQLVKDLFHSGSSPYSHNQIRSVRVTREGFSDVIKLRYEYHDPGITANTLRILTEVFMNKYTDMLRSQSSDVVAYFMRQVALAEERLLIAENDLKTFRTEKKILNYQEQTKFIASQKEDLEKEYLEELSRLASAQAGVERMEEQLSLNRALIKFSSEVLTKRRELSELNGKIAQLEIYSNEPEKVAQLKKEADLLKADLSNTLETRYAYSKTTEGMKIEDLLREWLTFTLAYDEAKARLEVLKQRRIYFDRTYDEFAPLGSQLKRLERKIDLEEDTFLELLHGLNLAKIRQKNIEMSNSLKVTDQPRFPIAPLPSKTMILVIVAFIMGLMLPIGIIILREFLDQTIKFPERAERLSRLRVLGAFADPTVKLSNIDYDQVDDKSSRILLQNIRWEWEKHYGGLIGPRFIGFASAQYGEDKTKVMKDLALSIQKNGRSALLVTPNDVDAPSTLKYRIDTDFTHQKNMPSFLMELGRDDWMEFDYILMEFPALLEHSYSMQIVREMHFILFCIRAPRIWKSADMAVVDSMKDTKRNRIAAVLTKTHVDYLDSVLGTVPKRRTRIRRLVKSILTFEFSNIR
ncbi:hypothetical protein HZ996_10535 [Cryomorphaceae bacterium]|nr:hypothetical protein HZ996_10535 [Cryomorphaceae bacterium]